jgi:hypothetical protein
MTKTEANILISKYYPDHLTIEELESKYSHTKEFKNLEKICKEAESLIPLWKEVISKVKDALPSMYSVQDWTHLFNFLPSYRLLIIYPPDDQLPKRERHLMLNVSILADYYSIYISEKDYNVFKNEYTPPVLAIKNSYVDDYLKIKPFPGSVNEFTNHLFEKTTTKEFIRKDLKMEKLIYTVIEKTLAKYFPGHIKFDYNYILDRADNFTNGNLIPGEMTYFDCLFSDHIF